MKAKLNPIEAISLFQGLKRVEVRVEDAYPGLDATISGNPEMFFDNAENSSEFLGLMEAHVVTNIYVKSQNDVIIYCTQ